MIASLIIPVKNEESTIHNCLNSILNNNFPVDQFEILVIDGKSTDETLSRLKAYNWKGVSHQIIINEKQTVPYALNLGIRAAKGQFILRIDAHTEYGSTYISECIKLLSKKVADNVGGPMRVKYKTSTQQAVAIATSSFFGVGNSSFHFEDKNGYVESVYLGAFPKSTFEKFGFFDEEMVRNQDDEFNYRVVNQGGKIYLSPSIICYYYPRNSILKLISQYFQYGFWKVRVIQKIRSVVSLRHLAPSLLVIFFIVSISSFLFSKPPTFIQFFLIITYLLINLFFTITLSIKNKYPYPWVLFLTFTAIHFSYGIGFLIGLIRFNLIPNKRL